MPDSIRSVWGSKLARAASSCSLVQAPSLGGTASGSAVSGAGSLTSGSGKMSSAGGTSRATLASDAASAVSASIVVSGVGMLSAAMSPMASAAPTSPAVASSAATPPPPTQAGKNKEAAMREMDADRSGAVSMEEFREWFRRKGGWEYASSPALWDHDTRDAGATDAETSSMLFGGHALHDRADYFVSGD